MNVSRSFTGKTQRKSPRVGSHCTLGAYGTLDPSVEVHGLSHPSVALASKENL